MDLREARQAIRAAMQAVEEPGRVPGVKIKRIDFGVNHAVIKGEVVSVAHRMYGDAPGWSWTVRERGQFGRRTHYVWWLAKAEHRSEKWEAGTLTAYTVTGNHNKGTFTELASEHVITVEGLTLS